MIKKMCWVDAASVNGKVRKKAGEKNCKVNPTKNKTVKMLFEYQRENIICNQEHLRSIKIKSYYRNGKKVRNQAKLPWRFSPGT